MVRRVFLLQRPGAREAALPPAGEAADPPPPRPVDPAGLASFLCAALAIPAASLPWPLVLAGPLALLAILLGLVAVVLGPKKQRLALVGLLGGLVGGLLALWPGARLEPRSAPVPGEGGQGVYRLRASAGEPAVASTASTWINASREAAQQGVFRVRIRSAVIQPVPLEGGAGKRRWGERSLLLRLRLANVGADRLVRYVGWGAGPDRPVLVDSLGQKYPARDFGTGWSVVGQVRRAALPGGRWADDVLAFAAPPAGVAFLRLSLSAAAFGGQGELRLELPGSMIVFR